jgi:hypothetical protein
MTCSVRPEALGTELHAYFLACSRLLTRAEVFRRFAAQAREAAAAAAALADEEAEEEDGIDRTLDPDELMPGGVVFMVARPFPAVYQEGATIQ